MPTTKESTSSPQEEILDFVRRIEEAVLEAGHRGAEATADAVPMTPTATRRLIDNAFEATARILEAQRDLAKNLLDVVLGHPGEEKVAPDGQRQVPKPGRAESARRE